MGLYEIVTLNMCRPFTTHRSTRWAGLLVTIVIFMSIFGVPGVTLLTGETYHHNHRFGAHLGTLPYSPKLGQECYEFQWPPHEIWRKLTFPHRDPDHHGSHTIGFRWFPKFIQQSQHQVTSIKNNSGNTHNKTPGVQLSQLPNKNHVFYCCCWVFHCFFFNSWEFQKSPGWIPNLSKKTHPKGTPKSKQDTVAG